MTDGDFIGIFLISVLFALCTLAVVWHSDRNDLRMAELQHDVRCLIRPVEGK